jgi:hypothetical protein
MSHASATTGVAAKAGSGATRIDAPRPDNDLCIHKKSAMGGYCTILTSVWLTRVSCLGARIDIQNSLRREGSPIFGIPVISASTAIMKTYTVNAKRDPLPVYVRHAMPQATDTIFSKQKTTA